MIGAPSLAALVDAGLQNPTQDWAALSTPVLVEFSAVAYIQRLELACTVLDDGLTPTPLVWLRALDLVQNLRRADGSAWRESLTRALVREWVRFAYIATELLVRRAPEPGWVLIDDRARVATRSLGRWLENFGVDQLPDYQNFDPRDLRQTAMVAVFEDVQRQESRLWASLPVPDIGSIEVPGITPLASRPGWWWWPSYRRWQYRVIISAFQPLVTESAARLPEVAHTGWRDAVQERSAKKRGGDGGRKARAAGTQQEPISVISLDEHPEIDPGGTELSPEELVSRRQQAAGAFKAIEKLHRTKGRLLLAEVLAGTPLPEAAQKAGIHPKTAESWLSKLAATRFRSGQGPSHSSRKI